MTKKTLVGLLGLSLLFNVFVLLGFAQARRAVHNSAPPTDESVVKQVANELKLTDEQAKVFRELRVDSRRQADEVNETLMLVRHQLNAELRQSSPDLDLVRTLVDRESELHRMRRHVGAESFSRFVDSLTPNQRQMLSRRFDQNRRGGEDPRGGGPPPFMLKKFDANRNGKLEREEVDAAVERVGVDPRFSNEPRREPQRTGPAPWQRFDVNHNGMLEADELKKMDETRRERQRTESQ